MVHVSAFFAGMYALIYVALSFYVIARRYDLKLAVGDAADPSIIRRIRAHANFSEYVPLALVLMVINELNGTSKILLICIGIALTIGRLSHAYSLLFIEPANNGKVNFRQIGMVSTFLVIIILGLMAMIS